MNKTIRLFAITMIITCGMSTTDAQALTLERCHVGGVMQWAQCGELEVPEFWSQPEQRKIKLQIAVLPALENVSQPDPVFILAGGPGQSAIGIAAQVKAMLNQVNQDRDIVLVDQRGTGQSTPLSCDIDLDALTANPEGRQDAIQHCFDNWEYDTRAFTTMHHIRDLEAVRQALGYQKINLYGGSYGTRVGLVYLREYPDSIRTAVLDAVAPLSMRIGMEMGLDAQAVLDKIFERCRQDQACNERFPQLSEQFDQLLDRLEQNPVEIRVPNPVSGQLEPETLDARTLAMGLRGLLYSPATQRMVPIIIDHGLNGDWQPLIGTVTAATQGLTEVMTIGLMLSVLCTEDLAGQTVGDLSAEELASFVAGAQAEEFFGYCANWPQPAQSFDFSTPDDVEVPVLLLSGGLDPVTPPYRAESAKTGLDNARHLVVDHGGHIVAALGCMPDLVKQFYDSADSQQLDAECLEAVASPTFFTSLLGPSPIIAEPKEGSVND